MPNRYAGDSRRDVDELMQLGRPSQRPQRSDPTFSDPDELAAYGYAGQGYPLYGQPRGLDPDLPPEYAAPEPRWFADPGAIAYGAGFTPPLVSVPARSGQRGKGPKDYVRLDARIREDVCERLSDDDQIDASDISVSVHSGGVILEGEVSDHHDKRRAEAVASSVRGAIDVQNELRVMKSFLQQLGDKLSGDETEHRGHHGSGTRNAPAE